jgi:GNAT superfamily N-acetyltransferase
MPNINIRNANTADIDLLLKMWIEFTKLHDRIVIKKNPLIKPHVALKKNANDIFRIFIKKQILSKNALVTIAEVDGKPAGYVLCNIKENVPVYTIDKLGYIVDMYVAEKYQGLGISSRLKEKAIEWFKHKRIKHVSLVVFYDNDHAHQVYEKWGFFNYSVEMRKDI